MIAFIKNNQLSSPVTNNLNKKSQEKNRPVKLVKINVSLNFDFLILQYSPNRHDIFRSPITSGKR